MRAVLFRLRTTVRRRWLPTLLVAAVIAVVSAAVLTLAAGARRTAQAPDAFTAAIGGGPDATVTQEGGPPRTAEVAALPGLRSVDAMSFAFAALEDPAHPDTESFGFIGTRGMDTRLVAGRQADPDQPDEFVADRSFVAQHQAHLGDRFPVTFWTWDQVMRGEGYVKPPTGPEIEAVLVGILQAPASLEDDAGAVVFSPALQTADIGLGQTIMSVDLEPGTTIAELRASVDSLPDGSQMQVEAAEVIGSDIRTAVDAQARGTWLMALVAGLAALVALGQLLSRHVRLAPVDRQPLETLGFTERQLALEAVCRAAMPAIAGVLIGVTLAVLASGMFPAGFVRGIEPHPGVRVDPLVLVVGGALLLLGLLGWVGLSLLLGRHTPAVTMPSRASELVARRAPSPATAAGARFALTRHARSTTSALGTCAALGAIVAGIVAAVGFAASVDRLVTDGARFGSNYDFGVGGLTSLTASELRSALDNDPNIDGLMILSGSQARSGRTSVGIVGVEHVRGDLAPKVVAGRLPVGPDELAIGRVTARHLGVDVGDRLELAGPGGQSTYRVVGLAVVPTLGAIDGAGVGAVATADGLARLDSAPSYNLAAVVLKHGVPATVADDIAVRLGEPAAGVESPPASIVNVARVRRIPALLAGLLVGLALVTLVHSLLVSITGRRRDLAVLRALGADGGWIGRAVHSQATVLTIAPLVVGIPLGLLAGSVIFRAFVNRIGALPDPAIPVLLIVGLCAALVLVANAVSVVPAARARSVSTSRLLHEE
jgi:hypothetical protein